MNQAEQALIATRTAIGAGVWLAPRLGGRLFGLDPKANPQLPYVGRLFGARDVALAYGLAASGGEERTRWLRIGLACDLADVAASVFAGRSGYLPKLATVLVTGTAMAATGLGVAAMLGESQAPAA
ncbi:MAG TPA: hypothetical protein VG186_06985 [Solirubrobacteraceae bacterium]|jgi:hypothetical protein|nr:hypothetical protein [Solirubrobacteraceae bacterium]